MGGARRAALVSTALATAAVLATTGAGSAAEPAAQPAGVPSVESVTERVLQSVDVSMGPDGTTTGVGSSVVRATDSVEDAETSDESFSPEDVVGDLPVRVLTSWRTADGAGTDLSDLQGYDGRIAIDLTVQNLTVRPQVLSYDAAGVSREQAALVGSPLTVTASTALGDLKPERVVTDDKGTGVNVTNGVLSRSVDGTTVQWAALLAPPVLSSSSEMSLVVDAKDFDVPTFDLSVQPGLVTDPSIGALVDSAFNPATSGELDLQRRTIELITDVNVVLAKASDTITDVRSSLSSTSETLGTQTVSDLQSSTQSVTSNMRSLDGALLSLRSELDSTLKTTGSSAIAEMQSAVDTVDQMLGDTSAQPVTAPIRGTGCKTTVADPKQAGTVYGSLLQVAGQLKGYADATDLCKGAVKKSILGNIGPENPTPATCLDSTSVTCSLLGAQGKFNAVADHLNDLTDQAVELLRSSNYTAALDALTTLESTINDIDELAGLIAEGRNGVVGAMNDAVYGPDRAPGGAPGRLELMITKVDQASAGLDTVAANVASLDSGLDSLQGQADDAAAAICQLEKDGVITDAQASESLKYLVTESCDKTDLSAPEDGNGNGVADDSISERLDRGSVERGYLDSVGGAVRGGQRTLSLLGGSAANPADGSLGRLYTTLKTALDQRYGGADDGITFSALIDQLEGLSGTLSDQSNALGQTLDDLDANADEVAQIQGTIDTEIARAKNELQSVLDEQTEAVYGTGGTATEELGTMLERSASGLNNSADAVVTHGRKSLEGQKREFAAAQAQASNRISGTIERGLAQINSGVTSSTRDMEAATTLLVADLRTVLLDLGQRKVGGGGLLGAMATNAATASTADYQLGLAGDKATSYANVRGRDVAGLMLRQAQTDAAMQMLEGLPAFQLDLPSGSQHRTVYNFSIGDS